MIRDAAGGPDALRTEREFSRGARHGIEVAVGIFKRAIEAK